MRVRAKRLRDRSVAGLSVLVFATTGLALSPHLTASLGAARAQAQTVPEGWQTLENPGLGFLVQMPEGDLREGVRPLVTSLGELEMYVVGVDRRDRAYAVMVAEFPEFFEVVPQDTRFEGAIAGVATNLRRRLRPDRQASLAGYPGRVLFYEGRDGLIYEHHFYWVDSRLYQAIATIRAGASDEMRSQFFADAEPFFESFSLTYPAFP